MADWKLRREETRSYASTPSWVLEKRRSSSRQVTGLSTIKMVRSLSIKMEKVRGRRVRVRQGICGGQVLGRGRRRQHPLRRGPNLTNEIHATPADHVLYDWID